MIINILRSSSYNTWDICQWQYFLNYVLGLDDPSNKAAIKGTTCHLALECLANIKRISDKGGKYYESSIGELAVEDYLKTDENIHRLVEKAFLYCTDQSKTKHLFDQSDLKDCQKWTLTAIEYGNRMFDPRLRDIVEAEKYFEIPIIKDWAYYDYTLPNGKHIEDFLLLKGTIDLVTRISDNVLEVVDWKGLPLDTQIPTIYGWKIMEELKVGDIIFDELGQQTSVVGKSQIKYKDCYKIYFDDKSTVIADDEHLWKLNNGNIIKTQDLERLNKISLAKPIITKDVDLPIDPYVLGIWLGDGRNRNAEIASADPFIFEEIIKRGYKLGKNIEKRNKKCQDRTIYNTTPILRKLNLLHNKHIPPRYLRASYKQRLDLLRGLMDSDGSVNNIRKQAVFSSCNKQLSNNVKELLLSLGQRPNQSSLTRIYNGKNIYIYPLHFRPININPFLLPRKANAINKVWRNGRSHYRSIKKIEYVGKLHTQCIKVDSPTSTYLCTRNMIPTHNTGKRIDWSDYSEKDFKKLCIDPQLRIYHYALSHIFGSDKTYLISIFFMKDGGPFTLTFGEKDLEITERMLKERFLEIKNSVHPRRRGDGKSRFCNICNFKKGCLEGESKSMCQSLYEKCQKWGLQSVVESYTNPSFTLGDYSRGDL